MLIDVKIIWVQIDKKIQSYGRGLANHQDPDLILSCLPIVLFCIIFLFLVSEHPILGQIQNPNVTVTNNQSTQSISQPSVTDPNLRIEEVAEGFDFPTSMAFLGKNDFILLEKNTGNVIRLLNGNVYTSTFAH
jgi:glucose/arabinose dehydrogenase